MVWARAVAGLGTLLVLAAFAIGTEVTPSVDLHGARYTCGATIPQRWLASGNLVGPSHATVTAEDNRLAERVHAACARPEALLHWAFAASLGVGALAVLVGWTALRERELAPGAKPVPASSAASR